MRTVEWDEVVSLGPRPAGLYYLLVRAARNRREFFMNDADVIAMMLGMCRREFGELVAQLSSEGLVRMRTWPDGATSWSILRTPPEWAPSLN